MYSVCDSENDKWINFATLEEMMNYQREQESIVPDKDDRQV